MTNYFQGEWYADNAIMYSILDEIPLYSGNERSGSKFFLKTEKRTDKPISCHYKTTWRENMGKGKRVYSESAGGFLTKLYGEYPELLDIFKEFSRHHLSNFEFNSITINRLPKNNCMKVHKDKVNVGESCLVAFGDYHGGSTFVQNEKDLNYKIYDCREEYIKFNGAERRHFVNSVKEGLRYSLVFYNSKNCKRRTKT